MCLSIYNAVHTPCILQLVKKDLADVENVRSVKLRIVKNVHTV